MELYDYTPDIEIAAVIVEGVLTQVSVGFIHGISARAAGSFSPQGRRVG